MVIRFDKMLERDRQTDTQTDTRTPHDDIGRACIASRGKNVAPRGVRRNSKYVACYSDIIKYNQLGSFITFKRRKIYCIYYL